MSAGRFSHLETTRLRLVPLGEGNPEAIAAAIGEFEVARWLSRVPYPYSTADAEEFQRLCEGRDGQAWTVFDDEGCAGGVGTDGELGYWVARRAWGKGYATEMSCAVLDAFFSGDEVDSIPSGYLDGNERSRRVLEKLGFRPDGIGSRHSSGLGRQVPMHLMVLRRADWQAARLRIASN